MPKQPTTQPKQPTPSRHKHPLWLKLLIVVLAISIVSGISIGIAEFNFQQRINSLTSRMDQVSERVVKPLGGVQYFSNIDGDHVWNSWCVDNGPCPMVNRGWFVITDAGVSEDDYKKKFLQALDQESSAAGTNDGRFPMMVYVTTTEHANASPPYALPVGKEWLSIDIGVYER
jgi:hypothetical protein